MQTSKLIILFSFLILLFSCSKKNCEKEETICAAIPNKFDSMVPYEVGHSLRFVNDIGNSLVFDVIQTDEGNAKRSYCDHVDSDMDECQCSCNVQSGYRALTDDTTRIRKEDYRVLQHWVFDYSNGAGTSFGANINIFNSFFYEVRVEPLTLGNNQKMLDSIKLGNTIYYDVIEYETDTTIKSAYSNKTPVVWKAYFNLSKGLVGFHDRHTNSIFYLE